MKSIFIITFLFLAFDWPKSSICWQQYSGAENAQTSPLSAILGQQVNNVPQAYGTGFAGSRNLMGSGYRLNPELIMAQQSNLEQQPLRTAFSRAGLQGRARKASKFNLKPVLIDKAEAESEQHLESANRHRPSKMIEEAAKQVAAENVAPAATAIKSNTAEAAIEKMGQADSRMVEIDRTGHEIVKGVGSKQDAHEKDQQRDWIKLRQQQSEWLQQQPELHQQQQPELHQQQQANTKTENVKGLSYRARQMHAPGQFQQQHHQMYEQFQQQRANELPDELRFQVTKPDQVNSIGLNMVKNEAIKELKTRQEDNVPLSRPTYGQPTIYGQPIVQQPINYGPQQKPYNYGNKYAQNVPTPTYERKEAEKEVKNGYESLIGQRFNSLIMIINNNNNANLGVDLLTADLLRSFLSQFFLGQSVDSVLKDTELYEKIERFNAAYAKASSSYDNNYNSKPYEATSQLSANIPTYTADAAKSNQNKTSNSHSESTLVLKRNDPAGESTKNLQYGPVNNPNTYNYVPYGLGGVIVVNNVNDNINDRVRSILSGQEYNTSEHDAGMVLPLSKYEIDELMKTAVIINNGNSNKNKY